MKISFWNPWILWPYVHWGWGPSLVEELESGEIWLGREGLVSPCPKSNESSFQKIGLNAMIKVSHFTGFYY